jgi:hypothetical protein
MYNVQVEKECGCFKRSSFNNNLSFESKDDALMQAIEMSKEMNEEFCGKHEFKVVEQGDSIVIGVAERAKSGCCGGGHCG